MVKSLLNTVDNLCNAEDIFACAFVTLWTVKMPNSLNDMDLLSVFVIFPEKTSFVKSM